jgi:hypothetical protein
MGQHGAGAIYFDTTALALDAILEYLKAELLSNTARNLRVVLVFLLAAPAIETQFAGSHFTSVIHNEAGATVPAPQVLHGEWPNLHGAFHPAFGILNLFWPCQQNNRFKPCDGVCYQCDLLAHRIQVVLAAIDRLKGWPLHEGACVRFRFKRHAVSRRLGRRHLRSPCTECSGQCSECSGYK